MLDDGGEGVLDELVEDGDGDVTARLVEDDEVVCWTCGSEVTADQIDSALESLRSLRETKLGETSDIEDRLDELQSQQREAERQQERRTNLERRLDDVDSEIESRRDRLDEIPDGEVGADRRRRDARNRGREARIRRLQRGARPPQGGQPAGVRTRPPGVRPRRRLRRDRVHRGGHRPRGRVARGTGRAPRRTRGVSHPDRPDRGRRRRGVQHPHGGDPRRAGLRQPRAHLDRAARTDRPPGPREGDDDGVRTPRRPEHRERRGLRGHGRAPLGVRTGGDRPRLRARGATWSTTSTRRSPSCCWTRWRPSTPTGSPRWSTTSQVRILPRRRAPARGRTGLDDDYTRITDI